MDWIRESRYPQLAIANFIILTLFGSVLRYMQVYSIAGFDYQYVLHAHSHFAFAGWMFFALAILITHTLSVGANFQAYKTVFILTLVSAFGMLVTFSFQGYQFLSITFSTLFILVTYRFTYLALKQKGIVLTGASRSLIYSGLVLLCISSIGPFAMAPLLASGFRGTPLYQNAIYFYLHFQMNGFMLLTALGLFASSYLPGKLTRAGNLWLKLFIFSVVPLFTIFTLWTKPAGWVWIVALVAAVLNMVSWFKLCIYFKNAVNGFSFLIKAALLAITLKIVSQVLICIPVIGEWVFLNRDLIIGYIHLLTLGCIVPLILDQFIKRKFLVNNNQIVWINRLYILATALYLGLLFFQPILSLNLIAVPLYRHILLWLSLVFLVAGFLYVLTTRSKRAVSNIRTEF